LTSAAQPATADAVLLVESNGQRRGAAVAAWATTVDRGASHQGDVGRGKDGVLEPSRPTSDVVRSHGAVAVHARRLLELVTLLLRALRQWAVVLVLAEELVRAVAAVLDAVAALSVGNHLTAHALKAVGQARASDVVANRARGRNEREQRK